MSLLMCPESHGCINKFCREEKRTSRTTCRHRHHTENHGETFHTPELGQPAVLCDPPVMSQHPGAHLHITAAR